MYRHRDPTLLTPRDFDLSPYFEIVKFNVIKQRGFDYERIEWEESAEADLSDGERPPIPATARSRLLSMRSATRGKNGG